MGSCLPGGWRRGSCMFFLVAILHDNFHDPADVPARLLKFPLCQVDKRALDKCHEYLRRRLWSHRLLQLQELPASLLQLLMQCCHDIILGVFTLSLALSAALLILFDTLFSRFFCHCADSGALSLSSREITVVGLDRFLHLSTKL